jgi:hypothetical protein
MSQELRSPDGDRWKVGRRWSDRPLPRWRWRWRAERGAGAAMESGMTALDYGESVVVAIVTAVVVGLAVLILLPLVGIALELALLFALLSSGIVGRVVLRRPWIVEATNLDHPERSTTLAVKGWRRSGEAINRVVQEISAGGRPTQTE